MPIVESSSDDSGERERERKGHERESGKTRLLKENLGIQTNNTIEVV